MKLYFLFIAVPFFMISCNTYSEKETAAFDAEIQKFIDQKQLEMESSPSGLYFCIDSPGKGDSIRYNDIVAFSYTLKLLDGTLIERQTEPVEYKVNQLIGAWKEIMLQLKPGAKAYLVAPPQLCYGDRNLEDIPPNSTLQFELEVMKVY